MVRSRRRATRSPGAAPRRRRTTPSAAGPHRLRIVALVTLALLALWPPFAGGLSGDWGQFLGLWQAVLAVGLVFLLGLREKTGLPLTPARAAVVALWLAYVASLFVAVAPLRPGRNPPRPAGRGPAPAGARPGAAGFAGGPGDGRTGCDASRRGRPLAFPGG